MPTNIKDVEFGEELPVFDPDTSMNNVKAFVKAAHWGGGRGEGSRFTDHEAARREGLPGALIPGIMSQGFLGAMIHRWAPQADLHNLDTVFRAPLLVDDPCHINGVVTDIDEETGEVEIDITITNDAAETRVFGIARVRLAG